MKSRRIQIYGQFDTYWSNAYVSRGVAAAFAAHGFDVALYDRSATYEGLWGPRGPHYVCGMTDAPIGAFVGYPIRALEYLANHERKVGFFIAESAVVPQAWAACANQCDLVIVPSTWTAHAYVASGLNPSKLVVAHHGLHPCYLQQVEAVLPLARPRFLHIAGARDFIERKGTLQLIEAFGDAEGHLVIRTPHAPALQAKVVELGLEDRVTFDFHDTALPPEQMKHLLGQGWAAVVQPSRAEAFGLVPVEARACGIPVIMTRCAGHTEHAEPTDVVVTHGPDEPLAVNGIPNGSAPTVSAAAIAAALRRFVEHRGQYTTLARKRASQGYARRWRWEDVLRPVIERLAPPRRRIGTC